MDLRLIGLPEKVSGYHSLLVVVGNNDVFGAESLYTNLHTALLLPSLVAFQLALAGVGEFVTVKTTLYFWDGTSAANTGTQLVAADNTLGNLAYLHFGEMFESAGASALLNHTVLRQIKEIGFKAKSNLVSSSASVFIDVIAGEV